MLAYILCPHVYGSASNNPLPTYYYLLFVVYFCWHTFLCIFNVRILCLKLTQKENTLANIWNLQLGPHSISFYCVTLYVRRTLTGNYIYMYIQIKSNTFIDIVNALTAVEIRLCNILTVDWGICTCYLTLLSFLPRLSYSNLLCHWFSFSLPWLSSCAFVRKF